MSINKRIGELYEQYSDRPAFWSTIAGIINKEFGESLSAEGVRTRYKRYRKRNNIPRKTHYTDEGKPRKQTKIERNYDNNGNLTVASTSDRIKTIEDLLNSAKIDLGLWRVDRPQVTSWESMCKIDGEPHIETLYRVKVSLIPNKTRVESQLIEDLLEDLKRESPKIIYKSERDNLGEMLEISIPDLHFGKLAYRDEVNQDYNMKIAKQLFMDAVVGLSSCSRDRNIDTVLFPLGNDLFNADTPSGFTTAGTKQEMDGLYRHHFREVGRMVIDAIEYLKDFFGVKIVIPIIPGNHDRYTMFALGQALEYRYYNDEMVDVRNSGALRKYIPYGRVLLGLTHGSDEKINALPMIMSTEVPKLWGESTFREWHIAHDHRKKEYQYLPVFEENGVRVRVIPSLCSAEEWHYRKGYVKNLRSAEAYLWSRENGMVAMFMHNVGN